jgi:hypothetical protein
MNKRDIELQKRYDKLNDSMGIINTYKIKEEKKHISKLKAKKKAKKLKDKKNAEILKSNAEKYKKLNKLNESKKSQYVGLTYIQLLKKPQWKEKRRQIIKRDNFVCLVCKSPKELNVHHRIYIGNRLPWNYDNSCLATLCRKCHESIHKEPVNMKIMEIQLRDILGLPIKN